MEVGIMEECPICGEFVENSFFKVHVGQHFEDDSNVIPEIQIGNSTDIGDQRTENNNQLIHSFNQDCVICSICGIQITISELDSHEYAHQICDNERIPVSENKSENNIYNNIPVSESKSENNNIYNNMVQYEDDSVICSICGVQIAISELDSHEYAHQMQDTDKMEVGEVDEMNAFLKLQQQHGFTEKRGGHCFRCNQPGHWVPECPLNPASYQARLPNLEVSLQAILTNQRKEPQNSCNLSDQIQKCILSQKNKQSISIICSKIFHFNSEFDKGYGCGYRNLQMLSANLIYDNNNTNQVQNNNNNEYNKRMFGGCGFVPCVRTLQAWLEFAWKEGYDVQGREQLGGNVQGTRKWIGSSDVCAVFRSMGIKAQLSNFQFELIQNETQNIIICDLCGKQIFGEAFQSVNVYNVDFCSQCKNKPGVEDYYPLKKLIISNQKNDKNKNTENPEKQRKQKELQNQICQFVWKYFTEDLNLQNNSQNQQQQQQQCIQINKPPIYFQHQGHSRNIVGIEKIGENFVLIVMDPSTPQQELINCLQKDDCKKLKVRMQTLKFQKYQLMTINGVYQNNMEQENSKVLDVIADIKV